ncbi:MAG: hypothetical protein ABFD50_07630 [Smithella sp.]
MIYFDNAATTGTKPEDVNRVVDQCMRREGGKILAGPDIIWL